MYKINQENSKINQEDFENHLKKLVIFPNRAKLMVAVSGGADSLCLALLLSEFAKKNNYELLATIVDHKLRAESTEEANFVAGLLAKHLINSVILTRSEIPIVTGIQHKARDDRYDLLKTYAYNNDYPYLFIAHHLDDQLETISIRKDRGENIVGDSGMSEKTVSKQVILLRPFLNYTKKNILNSIKEYTKVWVEDPSNQNTKYTRVKHRFKIQSLGKKEKNILIEEYYKNIAKRKKLERFLLDSLSKCIKINEIGLIKINLVLFNKYDENIKILILRKLIKFAEGKVYEVKIQKIRNFLLKLAKNISFKETLGNCLLKIKKDEITIFKNRVTSTQVKINEIWDNRYLFVKNSLVTNNQTITKIDKKTYLENIKNKEFKEYLTSKSIDGDLVWGLPWVIIDNKVENWSYKEYEYFRYKVKNSIFMNLFAEY